MSETYRTPDSEGELSQEAIDSWLKMCPAVERFARSLIRGDWHAVEDIVQTVAITYLTHYYKHRDLYPNLLAHTLIITKRRVYDYFRKRNRDHLTKAVEVEEETPGVSFEWPVDLMATKELLAMVREEITNLSEPCRSPLTLWADGVSYADIAAILEQPIGTIKTRIHNGKQQVYRAIMRRIGEPPEPGG